jgi:uncharacterized protein (TIGR02266 family)
LTKASSRRRSVSQSVDELKERRAPPFPPRREEFEIMGEAAFRFDDEERLGDGTVPRTSLHVEIDVYSEHNFWSGITMNISEGGVFVATMRHMKPGTLAIVDMDLPGESEPLVALAEVTWSRVFSGDPDAPPGLGLSFVHICEESLAKIRRFVERIREPLLFEI